MRDLEETSFSGFGSTLAEKTAASIEILRLWELKALELDGGTGYFGCDSGGKDSVVVRELAVMAGVKVSWHHSVTMLEPPEVLTFLRQCHGDTVILHPRESFFELMAMRRGFPTCEDRWCCEVFKECSGIGRVKLTGVRWEESPVGARSWKTFQRWDPGLSYGAGRATTYMCNPLVHWSVKDVWEFIREASLRYCIVYGEGWDRVGCVGCPMRGPEGMVQDFERWPAIRRGWERAFRRLWERRSGGVIVDGKDKGKPWPGIEGVCSWRTLFEWWKSLAGCGGETEACQLGLW